MNHTQTSTSKYTLSKYSRSYPTKRHPALQIATQGSETGADWQHFTNPVIRLLLEVAVPRHKNDLESARLRILWTMEEDNSTQSAQPDVVLASLWGRFSLPLS